MKIIFWGTPQYSIRSLEKLINSNNQVVAVITQPDRKRSRGNKLIQSPIKGFSIKHNIPVLTPEKIKNNTTFIKILKEFNSDIFIVVAYGKILSKEILEIPKNGSWNAHASLLPRWRGAAPIQWSLLSGDEFTGVGIMKMEEGLDTGNILLEEKIKIEKNENLFSLTDKLSILSSDLLLNAIKIINDNINKSELKTIPQIKLNRDINYARMLNKKDYLLNFDDSAKNIFRKVNGLYPKAFIIYKKKNIKIIDVRIISEDEIENDVKSMHISSNKIPGIILGIKKNKGIIISTKTLPIIILSIKFEGKNISRCNQMIQQIMPKIGVKF